MEVYDEAFGPGKISLLCSSRRLERFSVVKPAESGNSTGETGIIDN